MLTLKGLVSQVERERERGGKLNGRFSAATIALVLVAIVVPATACSSSKGNSKGSNETTAVSVKPNFQFTFSTTAPGVPNGAATPVSLTCNTLKDANGNKQLFATWGAKLNGNYVMSGTLRGVKGSDQFTSGGGPGAANLTLAGDTAHALQRTGGTFTINGDLKSGNANLEFGSGPSLVKMQGPFTCP
jgi:hypothetical protein